MSTRTPISPALGGPSGWQHGVSTTSSSFMPSAHLLRVHSAPSSRSLMNELWDSGTHGKWRHMGEGEGRRKKELLCGVEEKLVASVGLSVYRKCKGSRRATLLMEQGEVWPLFPKSCCCFAGLHSYFLQATLKQKQPVLLCAILKAAEKGKLHKRSGFPQTSRSCFSKWTCAQRSFTATSLS